MAVPLARSDSRQFELALAGKAARGDRHAQRELFDAQRTQVHRTLYRILGSNREIDDLAQDTFVEVFRSIGSFRGESSLKTWVDSIAARVAFRYLSRRPTRTSLLAVVPEAIDASEPDHDAHARAALRRLYVILEGLEPKYRIAYALAVIDGRPLREVARITRVSLVAAKNRVWRARRMVEDRARRDPLLCELLNADQGGGS